MIIKGTKIEIPDSLVVDGTLDLSTTGVIELPNGLTIDGSLFLWGTHIAVLPDDLTVTGDLFLRGSKIRVLPDGLTVGGLFLKNTNINELPDSLSACVVSAYDQQLIACEEVQLGLIEKNKCMINAFKAPTERAQKLNQLIWEL